EELWARTSEAPRGDLLIFTAWPELSALPKFEEASRDMAWVIELVKGVRSIRAEMNVPPSAKPPLLLKDASTQSQALLARNNAVILQLARVISAEPASALPKGSAQFVIGEAVAALPLG